MWDDSSAIFPSTYYFNVEITPNSIPHLIVKDMDLWAGEAFSVYYGGVTDPNDGDPSVVTYSYGPSFISFDASTGILSGTAPIPKETHKVVYQLGDTFT